jgi:hypothetical protein
MSVDLIGPTDRLRAYPPDSRARDRLGESLPGPVRDLVIIFGGWGSRAAGEPLRPVPGQPTGTSELLESVRALGNPPLEKLEITALEGALMDAKGVQQAEAFIRSLFHPLGSLIIYGYSAGGLDAINLTWRIWQGPSYYDFSTRSLVFGYRAASPDLGIVRVDLLITVDAASGPTSSLAFRNIPPAVRKNINYFQTNPAGRPTVGGTASGARSHGGPANALDSTATVVENHDLTARYAANPGQAHGLIDNDTNEDVLQAIRGTLGYEAPPLLLPNGMMAG